MGNFISCAFAAPKLKNPKSTRVIFPTGGEIRQFRQPVKAAELMLECPNYFLVNSNSLVIGRRFTPTSADQDLTFGCLYVMIHMRRLNSVVRAADAAVFLMAANSATRRISAAGDKMSPVVDERPRLSLMEGVDSSNEYKYRLAVCRSRKPVLDTITEEPVCVR